MGALNKDGTWRNWVIALQSAIIVVLVGSAVAVEVRMDSKIKAHADSGHPQRVTREEVDMIKQSLARLEAKLDRLIERNGGRS